MLQPRNLTRKVTTLGYSLALAALLGGCARTEIVESPKTAFVPETGEAARPVVLWTSRSLNQSFDYLGVVKTRSWSYDGALERLVDGGQQLRADALIDVHYERVGFLTSMQAFAIKYKK